MAQCPARSPVLARFAVLLATSACACDPTIALGDRPRDAVSDAAPPDSGDSTADAPPPDATADAPADTPDVGPAPTLLWSSNAESGDFSDWESGGIYAGGTYSWEGGWFEVTDERAHAGTQSIKFVLDTNDTTVSSHGARAYRAVEPGPTYYSAWFFIDAPYTATDWWSIFIFHAQLDPEDFGNTQHLWEIRVVDDAGMKLQFYDHFLEQGVVGAPTLPISSWFHLEAEFEYAPPTSSLMTVWLDGVEVFRQTELGGATDGDLYWVVGNGADSLMPAVSTLFVDDAAIATGRLGPDGF